MSESDATEREKSIYERTLVLTLSPDDYQAVASLAARCHVSPEELGRMLILINLVPPVATPRVLLPRIGGQD